MQPLGQAAGGERGGVHAVDGRIELGLDGELLRRPPPQRWTGVQPAGEPVAEHGVGAEPGRDVRRVERGERAQAPQPEAAEEVDEGGAVDVGLAVELLHAERGEEGGRVAGRDGHRTTGGQHGGEQPVGEPRLHLHAGAGGDLVDQPLRRRQLAAEPARRAAGGQRHQAGTEDLHPRRQLLDRDDHRLERPRVPIQIGGEDGRSGQRAWASRRRSPRRTPCARATAEHASTRPATNTAAG